MMPTRAPFEMFWRVLSTLTLLSSEAVGELVRLGLCHRDHAHHVGKPFAMDVPPLHE
jgi:hypothetical protein